MDADLEYFQQIKEFAKQAKQKRLSGTSTAKKVSVTINWEENVSEIAEIQETQLNGTSPQVHFCHSDPEIHRNGNDDPESGFDKTGFDPEKKFVSRQGSTPSTHASGLHETAL